MDTLLDRLVIIKDLKSKSVRSFAASIGCQQVTIDRQLKGERSISIDTVIAVLNTYPDISAEWLLRGTASMLITDELRTVTIGYQKASSNSTINNAIGTCAHAHVSTSPDETTTSAEIEALREENARLQAEYKRIQDLNISLTEKLMKML